MKGNSKLKAGKMMGAAFAFCLLASQTFAASISLSWDASPSTNVVGYTVYYGNSSGSYSSQVDAGNQTSAVVQGINRQTNYFFTVTARSSDAAESLPSNEVNLPSEKNLPQITVTSPGASFSTTNGSVNLTGTASDDYGLAQVSWSNQCSQVTGLASGTTSWSVANVSLCVGTNRITVAARDGAGNVRTALVTVVRSLPIDNSPQISITIPTFNSTFSTTNSSVNLAGTASDDQSLAQISWTNQCSQATGLASGTTSWSVAHISLCVGTNVLSVTARDAAGKATTVSIAVIRNEPPAGPCGYSISSTSVEFSENGGETTVDITTGATCEWTVVGGADWVQIKSPNAGIGNGTISFSVRSNSTCLSRNCLLTIAGKNFSITQAPGQLTVQSVSGTFNGMFSGPLPSPGFFTLKKGTRLGFTGTIKLEGKQFAFSGKFDTFGYASTTINRKSASPFTLQAQLNPCSPDILTAVLSDGTWASEFSADRAAFNSLTAPAPYEGKYTVAIAGLNAEASTSEPEFAPAETSPEGIGFAAVKVMRNGLIKVSGNLGDGEKFVQTTFLSKDGIWPCFVPLYRKAGLISGVLTFQPGDIDPQGDLLWVKPPIAKHRYYPEGFSNSVAVIGSPYHPPASLTNRVLNFEIGTIVLDGNNPAGGLAKDVMLLPDNRIVPLAVGDDKLSVRIRKDVGTFSGTIKLPSHEHPVKFKGGLLQNQNAGYGLFLGTNHSGQIVFESTP